MRITATGHAGLFIETARGTVLCDPWRSPAYFASWFVFPDNSDIDFAALKPDFLYISHLHRDHFDPELLKKSVPKSATVLLPQFPTDELRSALCDIGFSSFVETTNGEPVELDGLRVMITAMVAPSDGPIGDSALSLDDGECRVLNQNDARPPDPEQLNAFGAYDGHFLQFSGAIWWPVVYELAEANKSEFARRKRLNGMERARRFVDSVGARYVFPTAGPPCFLDDDLFEHNDFTNRADNIFPDQTVFLSYLAESGLDNGRLLIPGSVATLDETSCALSHPIAPEELRAIFDHKRQYLEAYAKRQRPVLEREHASWPRYEGDILGALKAWFEPLLELADNICEGVGAPVLVDLGEEKILIDFTARQVRAFAGEECRYRFSMQRRLVEALVATHEIDWVNSLFLSMRFGAKRRGQYNEYVFAFFKCLSPERMSYAEGWYAEKSSGDDLVALDGFMVQRRCPHLKADLSRFGTVCDGVLECAMHGWRFELATGQCLTAAGHDIVAVPIEPSG
ncbi:MAG: Rieske 2Fe-2S domain-containing protein [Acidimicrobiales bacterium]|jgi:UDP-MurNAc hydroxylase